MAGLLVYNSLPDSIHDLTCSFDSVIHKPFYDTITSSALLQCTIKIYN